jgi:hypothetical protein
VKNASARRSRAAASIAIVSPGAQAEHRALRQVADHRVGREHRVVDEALGEQLDLGDRVGLLARHRPHAVHEASVEREQQRVAQHRVVAVPQDGELGVDRLAGAVDLVVGERLASEHGGRSSRPGSDLSSQAGPRM